MKSLIASWVGMVVIALGFSTSAFAYGGSVAIVFNPQTGAYGSFHGASSRVGAEVNAMRLCGPDCAVDVGSLENRMSVVRETWAINGWVALARGFNGVRPVYGTSSFHDSEYDAEASAVQNCGGAMNGCQVIRSLSSYVYGPDYDGIRTN